jgi:hypothetical protein
MDAIPAHPTDFVMPKRPRRSAVALLSLFAIAVLLVACGGSVADPGNHADHGPYPFTNVPAPANGVSQFSMLPVGIASGLSLTALGSLNPPGHVLPTDHVYFYDGDLAAGHPFGADTRTVYMLATGAVTNIIQSTTTDNKVIFRATNTFYFYLDHVVLAKTLTVGQVIQAGTAIGSTALGASLDLGAFDETVTHSGFITPARYGEQTRFYVSPWKYFTPDLQAQIAPHMYRTLSAASVDGKIDFSIAGKLVGDWFLQGMPADSTGGPYGWPRSVAFVYDYYDPSLVRISIGGTIGAAGVWAIVSTAPRPEDVSVATGLVRYKLYSQFDPGFPSTGLLLVQMTDDATIKIELFTGSAASATQFDGGAYTFVR